jgi:hypothetical protein
MADENTGDKNKTSTSGDDGGSGGTGGKSAANLSDSAKKLSDLEAEKQALVAEARGLREKGREKEAKLKDLEEQLSKIEADKLKEQGHYKKLYEETLTKLGEVTTKSKRRLIRSELKAAVTEAGATDPDVARLIDTDDLLTIEDEDDLSEAIRDKVARHKEGKPLFYKGSKANSGSGDGDGDGDDEPGTRSRAPRNTGTRKAPPKPAGKVPPEDVRSLSKADYESRKRDHLRELRNQNRKY